MGDFEDMKKGLEWYCPNVRNCFPIVYWITWASL